MAQLVVRLCKAHYDPSYLMYTSCVRSRDGSYAFRVHMRTAKTAITTLSVRYCKSKEKSSTLRTAAFKVKYDPSLNPGFLGLLLLPLQALTKGISIVYRSRNQELSLSAPTRVGVANFPHELVKSAPTRLVVVNFPHKWVCSSYCIGFVFPAPHAHPWQRENFTWQCNA
eukprot:1002028-Pelagomonas_calceolata.AAC.12